MCFGKFYHQCDLKNPSTALYVLCDSQLPMKCALLLDG